MYDAFQTDRLIDLWLAEDIGACDLTAQVMIEADERGAFTMNAREPIVVAGIDIAARVFKRYDPDVDALAITVGKGGPVAQTRELAHGILADFDARGVMLSLEILDARQRVGEQLFAQLTERPKARAARR